MASRRPYRVLTEAESGVWQAIAEPAALATLDMAVVQDFWRNELCELAEPAFPAARRRVLVIEPHSDDAALSLGGVMWQRRHECEFIVATVASRSNFTSYFYLDREYFRIQEVMALRQRESDLFARLIGGSNIPLGMTDAPLRYRDMDWSLQFFRRHRQSISAVTERRVSNEERLKWVSAVERVVTDTAPEEIWIPLGSPHTDHRLTGNACLAALGENAGIVAGREIRLYQEVPYAANFPQYTGEMIDAIRKLGVTLAPSPEVVPIGDVFEQKLRLISIFASQFKLASQLGGIEASARACGAGPDRAEMLWPITAWPAGADYAAADPLPGLNPASAAIVRAWLARNGSARQIRVMLLVPTGRWASDLEFLLEKFPVAQFELFVSPAAMAEVMDAPDARVRVYEVGAGFKAWGLLSARLVLKRPVPTLFYAGERRLRAAKWLTRLWLFSDTQTVGSMNVFMRAAAPGAGPAKVRT